MVVLRQLCCAVLCAGCVIVVEAPRRAVGEVPAGDPDRRAVELALDDFHAAASEADGTRYFAHLADGAVFLGTDGSERWDVAAFQAYAEPYFGAGKGWTFLPIERHVFLSSREDVAWFDERLDNEKYGECRGSGVLVRHGETWRIAQYNLTFVVPNDVAPRVVELIRSR
jgi:hypothetical protein